MSLCTEIWRVTQLRKPFNYTMPQRQAIMPRPQRRTTTIPLSSVEMEAVWFCVCVCVCNRMRRWEWPDSHSSLLTPQRPRAKSSALFGPALHHGTYIVSLFLPEQKPRWCGTAELFCSPSWPHTTIRTCSSRSNEWDLIIDQVMTFPSELHSRTEKI